jgi:cob(I)alamin adenosyltransferase
MTAKLGDKNKNRTKNMIKQNLVTIYTGDGQGKTTAALGMAVKALNDGKLVYIGQFTKGEIDIASHLAREYDRLQIESLGFPGFNNRQPNENDRAAALAGLDRCKTLLSSGMFDLMILDELCVAIHHGLINEELMMDLLDQRPDNTALIITGANAPQWLIKMADCVTEMHALKQTTDDNEAILCDAIVGKN